jgi:hypothetical protein
MNSMFGRTGLLMCILVSVVICTHAQKGGGGGAGGAGQQAGQGGQTGQAAQGGGSGSGMQGLSFTPSQWPYMGLPNAKDPDFSFKSQGRVVVCYRLAKGNSASQPYTLEPLDPDDIPSSGFELPCGQDSEGETAAGDLEGQRLCKKKENKQTLHWSPCTELQKDSPSLKGNQILVIGVDISDITEAGPDANFEFTGPNRNQIKLFNINVTNQQGSPLNPAPLRASFPGTASSGGGAGAAGSSGRVISENNQSEFVWVYLGTHAPGGLLGVDPRPLKWLPNHWYNAGDVVSDATGVDFYELRRNKAPRASSHKAPGSQSAKKTCQDKNPGKDQGPAKDYCSGAAPNDPFPDEQIADRITDGDVIWQEASGVKGDAVKNANIWAPNHADYEPGEVVCVSRDDYDAVSNDKTVQALQSKNPNLVPKDLAAIMPMLAINSKQSLLSGKCSDLENTIGKKPSKPGTHLHYYFAVKGGRSGAIPQDPFSVQSLPRAIYIQWPYLLPGDVIPTFNVNLVYTPPTPGAPWQGNTFYPAGSVVTPSTGNGHYYTTLTGGFSGIEPQEPKFPAADPESLLVSDGSLHWLDSGTTAPSVPSSPGGGNNPASGGQQGNSPGGNQGGQQGGGQSGKPMIWMPLTHFSLGDTVIRPETGHFFVMVKSSSGNSGAIPASSGNGPTRNDPFPAPVPAAPSYVDGQIIWTKASAPCVGCAAWKANNSYKVGIQANIGGFSYLMTGSTNQSGVSGPGSAPFAGAPFTDNEIQWQNVPNATSTRAWNANTPYSIGQVACDPLNFNAVTSTCAANYTFVVQRVLAGTSGSQDPSSQSIPSASVTVQDGDLVWTAVAPADVIPSRLKTWAVLTPFNAGGDVGDFVQAQNGQYYTAIRATGGVSGNSEPGFPITEYCTVADPVVKVKDNVGTPGNPLEWLDLGTIRPRNSGNCTAVTEHFEPRISIPDWNQVHSSNVPVPRGAVIFEPGVEGGQYYEAIHPGTTGTVSPFVNVTPPMVITWLDSGVTPPASVSSGQPADQTISLINLTLPQTHTLSRFNISAGVAVTFVKTPTFAWVVPTTPGVTLSTAGVTATTTTTSGGTTTTTTNTYYLVPASDITIAPGQSAVATTAPSTGASAAAVAVDPESGCTYGITPYSDNSPYPGNPKVANASVAVPVTVYPVYECPFKTGKSTRPVDALLDLTAYIWPVDAEVPWHWNILKYPRDWAPAPSVGLSLSNPANAFFIGGSSEFGVRNLQIAYGYSFHNAPTHLAAGSSQSVWGGQGAAPAIATASTFATGWYVGATFNLSSFVQTLFGGGGGAK